jgi:hypothetical protein
MALTQRGAPRRMKHMCLNPVVSGKFQLDYPQSIQDIRCLESYDRLRPSPLARALYSMGNPTAVSMRSSTSSSQPWLSVWRSVSELANLRQHRNSCLLPGKTHSYSSRKRMICVPVRPVIFFDVFRELACFSRYRIGSKSTFAG